MRKGRGSGARTPASTTPTGCKPPANPLRVGGSGWAGPQAILVRGGCSRAGAAVGMDCGAEWSGRRWGGLAVHAAGGHHRGGDGPVATEAGRCRSRCPSPAPQRAEARPLYCGSRQPAVCATSIMRVASRSCLPVRAGPPGCRPAQADAPRRLPEPLACPLVKTGQTRGAVAHHRGAAFAGDSACTPAPALPDQPNRGSLPRQRASGDGTGAWSVLSLRGGLGTANWLKRLLGSVVATKIEHSGGRVRQFPRSASGP